MRKLRRLTAMLVTIATVASLFAFSITSSATEKAVSVTESDIKVIEKLEDLGVINNDYDASSYVTRRQIAEIIKTYMGLPKEATGSGDNQFNDVKPDDASYGAISTLRDLEVITGDENNNFRPDEYVNYNEAVVFIVNAVGHKYFALREGGYPTGYMRIAIKHDMLENLSLTNGSDFVPLVDIYKMMDKALDAATIIPQYYGDGSVRYTISETDNFLSENYGVYKYSGNVTGNVYTSFTNTGSKINDEQIEIDGVIYDTPGYMYGYLLGYTVNYYVKHLPDGYELVYVEEAEKKNSVFEIDSDDIITSKVTSDRIYYRDEADEEEHIYINDLADVVYNNQWYRGYGTISNVLPQNGYIKALDNDNNDVYDILFVYDYTIAVVESTDSYDETIFDRITNSEIDLSTNVRRVDIVSAKTLVAAPFGSIQKDEVLNIATGRGADKIVTVYVSDETVTGKITGYSTELGYEIDGKYYKPTYNYADDILAVGLEGTFYLDMSGKIAAYEYTSTSDSALYAAMAGVEYNEASSFNLDIRIKVFASKGTFVEAPLAENVKINNRRYDLSNRTEANQALNLLCNGYQSGGKFTVNESYVLRYSMNGEGEVTYIDTGAIGGNGNLNIIADRYMFCATRDGRSMIMSPVGGDAPEADSGALYTRLASDALVFVTPKAGELSDIEGYGLLTSWRTDHSYANENHISPNFSSATSLTLIDNLSAYNMGGDEVPVAKVLILRGATKSVPIGRESKMHIITEMTDSADEEGEGAIRKTLYEGDKKLGQLADSITVTEKTLDTVYTAEQFIAANILQDGMVIRYGTDADGKINQISVVTRYDSTTDALVPFFKGETAEEQYMDFAQLYGSHSANTAVAEINVYDADNKLLDFSSSIYDFVCNMEHITKMRIYDTATGKIREVSTSEIRSGDKCVMLLGNYFRVNDLIIFR